MVANMVHLLLYLYQKLFNIMTPFVTNNAQFYRAIKSNLIMLKIITLSYIISAPVVFLRLFKSYLKGERNTKKATP